VALRDLDRFVDDDAIRNVEPVRKLPCADHDHRALDRRQRFHPAVDGRSKRFEQRRILRRNTAPELEEICGVGACMAGTFCERRGDRVVGASGHLALVQALENKLARASPRRNGAHGTTAMLAAAAAALPPKGAQFASWSAPATLVWSPHACGFATALRPVGA